MSFDITFHYSDVTWAPCCLKSLVSNHQQLDDLFNSMFRLAPRKFKTAHIAPFWVNPPVTTKFPHKGPVIQNTFPYHDSSFSQGKGPLKNVIYAILYFHLQHSSITRYRHFFLISCIIHGYLYKTCSLMKVSQNLFNQIVDLNAFLLLLTSCILQSGNICT